MGTYAEIIADQDRTIAVMKRFAERGVIAAREDMEKMKDLVEGGKLTDIENNLLTQRIGEIEKDLAKWKKWIDGELA